jgi:hypothetical protein
MLERIENVILSLVGITILGCGIVLALAAQGVM